MTLSLSITSNHDSVPPEKAICVDDHISFMGSPSNSRMLMLCRLYKAICYNEDEV